jgi:hypothetical protein
MADDDENPVEASDGIDGQLDDDGLLDANDTLLGNPGDDPLDPGYNPPDNLSAPERFGTTLAEEREGETMDQLLAEEEPDIDPYAQAEREALTGEERTDDYIPAGRLVEEDEGAHEDTEADLVADAVGMDSRDESAEEAAVHIIGEND